MNEMTARLAILNSIFDGETRPTQSLQDKRLSTTLMKLLDVTKTELVGLVWDLEEHRKRLALEQASDLALAEQLLRKWN